MVDDSIRLVFVNAALLLWWTINGVLLIVAYRFRTPAWALQWMPDVRWWLKPGRYPGAILVPGEGKGEVIEMTLIDKILDVAEEFPREKARPVIAMLMRGAEMIHVSPGVVVIQHDAMDAEMVAPDGRTASLGEQPAMREAA